MRTFSSGLGGIPPTSPDPAEISAALPGTPGNKRARSVSDGIPTCKGQNPLAEPTGSASSASYIAVPAAMRIALPEANPGIYLPMALALTFPVNMTLGIPWYYWLVS